MMATRFMAADPGTWSPERLARSRAVSAGAHSSAGADRTARLGRACQPASALSCSSARARPDGTCA